MRHWFHAVALVHLVMLRLKRWALLIDQTQSLEDAGANAGKRVHEQVIAEFHVVSDLHSDFHMLMKPLFQRVQPCPGVSCQKESDSVPIKIALGAI